jgi:predicted transcriptional regulator
VLRSLRKRAGMTQGDLAAAVGYSDSFISALEQGQRLPEVEWVVQRFVPALVVGDEPHLAAQLVELAAAARGERPPASVMVQRAARVGIQTEVEERIMQLPVVPTELIGRTAEVNQLGNRVLEHSGRLLNRLVKQTNRIFVRMDRRRYKFVEPHCLLRTARRSIAWRNLD